MSLFEQNKEMYDKPIRLNAEQRKEPLKVFADFFSDFHLHESREYLAEWLECALTTNNPQFAESNQRAAIFVFYQKLEELIEAAYVLKSMKQLRK